MRRTRGFTLIEVMVALLVMAVMAVLAWRGIDALLKTRDIAQASVEQSTRLQTVMAQWDRDLQMLQDDGVDDALSFDGASLRLTRRQERGMVVIAWTVREGRLYRWQSESLQTLGALESALEQSRQFVAGDAQRLPLLEGVSGWQLYCYRDSSWSNCQSSGNLVTTGSGSQRQQLPTGLRMVLQFDANSTAVSGFQGSLTRTVMLPAQP